MSDSAARQAASSVSKAAPSLAEDVNLVRFNINDHQFAQIIYLIIQQKARSCLAERPPPLCVCVAVWWSLVSEADRIYLMHRCACDVSIYFIKHEPRKNIDTVFSPCLCDVLPVFSFFFFSCSCQNAAKHWSISTTFGRIAMKYK